ncbi:MAG: carboxypeptidase-like regulatory domain-containing protein [Chitinispirillales bacterium]|jgi:hypothetical protein|nr:carboxypeptidase-like regulatory domain-containing protein [Chitinispirillales bacterium]
MLRKIEAAVLSVLACFAFAAAAQKQSLKIVPDPSSAGVRAQDNVVRVKWVQLSEDAGAQSLADDPRDAGVYYSATPSGGNLARYTRLASAIDSNVSANFYGASRSKSVSFVPNRQGGRMGPGVYYIIVASVNGSDTLYSDYFRLMVRSEDPPAIESPKANIVGGEFVKTVTELAPVFRWKPVPGVPYYHIILSDKPFINSNNKLNTDVNIIWQAITQNTQITYGAPDPSNTITSAPPPLALGTTYSWMVLNNYGNRPEFTSWEVLNMTDGVAGRFKIGGDAQNTLRVPRAQSPRPPSNTFRDNDQITFKWNNLDTRATSYLVNILREGTAATFGMEGMGDFKMGLLAWETTVPRGSQTDALNVTLDAAGTLTGGLYKWRVYALDSRGAAFTDSTDTLSASPFNYTRRDEGAISIATRERIGDTTLAVGYVELKLEVLSGPTMAPLLFYTGSGGLQERAFAAGTYRITAVKEGYFTYTTTVTVSGGRTTSVNIPMSRPEAVLYGRVLTAADSSAVSAAKVTAVSELGDTVSAVTDSRGAFTISCRAAEWSVTVEKSGFQTSSRMRVSLRLDDNLDIGSTYLARSPFALSGVVRNSNGQPVMGARVRILRDGAIADELASTPQNGAYVFYLNSGTYTITAEKPGFAMFSRSVAVVGAMTQNITIKEGAVVVSGVITGKRWVASVNDYRAAPIVSARVTFADAARPDTFTVTSDAVFGKFSVSLPIDRDYKVIASAAGFSANGNARDFNTRGVGGTLAKPYADDTLYALATIKASVTGADEGVPVDVIVYDANDNGRVIASGRIVVSGNLERDVCELSNIPDGNNIKIVAGAERFFTRERDIQTIAIRNGSLAPNREVYNFPMERGNGRVSFNVAGYAGGGVVKVVSPLNRTIPFVANAPGVVAELNGVGNVEYVVGVVPSDTSRLELSYHKFAVSSGDPRTESLSLPFTYTARSVADIDTSAGFVKINWPAGPVSGPSVNRVELYYRSEGSARFDSIGVNVEAGMLQEFKINRNVRDGCNLYHYFRVYTNTGDIYGSSNQLYRTYVRPNEKIISRVVVEPGVTGGDTLVMSSSYPTVFTFKAFYGDQFGPIIIDSVGTVSWKVWRVAWVTDVAREDTARGTGTTFSYTTPSPERGEQYLILQAVLTPSRNGYKTKSGAPHDTVLFPVRVTGKALKSISILRNGDAGPILNTETAGFRVEAFDTSGTPVTVLPREWRIYPNNGRDSAGTIDGYGLFKPNPGFVGMAGIVATVGGRRLEYTEPGAEIPGQRVNYLLRRSGSVANTLKGMRVIFDTVRTSTVLEVTVPQLKNYIHRGTENYTMADTVAFDMTVRDTSAIGGNIVLEFDVPRHLRDAVGNSDYEFRVGKWFPDSLQWVPTDSTRITGGVVSTVLSPLSAASEQSLTKAKAKRTSVVRKVSKAAALFGQVSKASAIYVSARYALVLKTSKTSLSLSISPHPFSPYIVPKKEYPNNRDTAGTCIKVNIQAPDPFVKSVKVRVHNAAGKMVWGVEKLGAQTGENRFWWNGRTSGSGGAVSEIVWSEDYYNSNRSRPMCRNGRYYVMVILTDMEGKQKRVMKPLVLMK